MANWWDGLDEEAGGSVELAASTPDDSLRQRFAKARKESPRTRGLWGHIVDALTEGALNSPLGAEPVARTILKAKGHSDEQINRAERRLADRLSQRRETRELQFEDADTLSPANIGKWTVDLAGNAIGGADITTPIAPGRTIAQRVASQVGINAGVDALNQGIQIKRGVRDEFDPLSPVISGAAGGLLQGGGEAVGRVRTGRRVARGSKMPGWKEVNDVIVRDLEGGGTLKNPKVSPKGAMGPQQVMPATARKPGFGIRPWNGKTQEDLARVGRQYSAALMDKYDGDVAKVLAAYNAGPGRVDGLIKRYGDKWVERLPRETRNYVEKGMNKLYGSDADDNLPRGWLEQPEDLGDIRLVQDEVPTIAEMARVNNALAPKDVIAFPREKLPELTEDELGDLQAMREPGDVRSIKDFKSDKEKARLDKATEDNYWMARTVFDAIKRNDPGIPSRQQLKQILDDLTRSSFGWAKDTPEYKNISDTYNLIRDAHNILYDREQAALGKDVLTPAERQEMDASVPNAPDVPQTMPKGLGKGSVATTPVNDIYGLRIFPSKANPSDKKYGLSHYDLSFDTPAGKGSAFLAIRDGVGVIDIEGAAVNQLGPAAIKRLTKELTDGIPELNILSGFRVTGARGAKNVPVDKKFVRIKLREPKKLDTSDVAPPPRPPFPGEPGFPKPGEPGNRGGPKGGEDEPFDIRRAIADSEEALAQIEQAKEAGNIPLTVEQLNDTIKSWRARGLVAIKSKEDPELRAEATANIRRVISELEAMQDRLIGETPKPRTFSEKVKAQKAAEEAAKAEKPKKSRKTKKDENPEGFPEAPEGYKPPPPREPIPPRDGDGDGGDGGDGRSKYLGNINTERLELNDETYEILEEVMADHAFDHQTYGEMKAEAEKLLKNTPVSAILTADPKLSEAIPYQIAIRTILRDSLNREVEISRMILDPSQRSDELIGIQNLQRVKTAAAADAAAGIAGRAGRLLSSFKVNVGDDMMPAKALQEMLKLNPGRMDPESYAEAFLRMWNNNEGRVKLAVDSLNPQMIDYIIQMRYSMMLSGMGTHVKNTVETMKVIAQTIAENLGAVPIGMVTRSADRVTGLESAARMYGLWRAALNADTWHQAGQSFKEGTPVNKVSKVEGSEILLPMPFSLPQRALAAADSFWRGFIETSDIYGMAMRKAYRDGFRGKEMWDEGERIAQESFNKAADYNKARQDYLNKKISKKEFEAAQATLGEYKDIIEHSEHHAEVLQMLSEPSTLTRWIERGKTRKANMTFGQKAVRLVTNLLFPFARVSDRLFFHAIRRSPLFFLDNESMKAMRAGGAERDQVISRVLMGSAALSYYAMQAWNGERTGEGPRNPQKRGALIAGGWQPNSTFDPETGTYRDSSAFATVGIPAGYMATLVERYKAGEIGEEGYLTAASEILRSLVQTFTNNTYLEGGGSLFNALEDTPLGDTAWANFWGGMGSSFVPAALRQYNSAADPVQRDTTGDRSFADRVLGRVQSGIPEGLGVPSSEELPARSDVYGQNITKDPDLGTMITGVGKERQAVTDPVMVELQRLEQTQNETLVTPPAKAWDGVKLNAEQFQEYQRLSGQVFIDNMREQMTSFEWLDMSDDEKKKIVKKVLNASRKEVRNMLFPKQGEPANWWEGLE